MAAPRRWGGCRLLAHINGTIDSKNNTTCRLPDAGYPGNGVASSRRALHWRPLTYCMPHGRMVGRSGTLGRLLFCSRPLFRRPHTPLATVVDSHGLSVKPISVKQGGRNGGPLIHGGSPPVPSQPARERQGPNIRHPSLIIIIIIRPTSWANHQATTCLPTKRDFMKFVTSTLLFAGRLAGK